MSQPKRPLTADDLYQFTLITDCQIAPDGRHVVYAVQRIHRETEKKHTNLWIAPTGGGSPRQFTYGDQADTRPRWSPDGSEIAFLSNRADEKQPQLYIIRFDGGEARRLTDLKGSVGAFQWSPDGRQLLLNFRRKDPDALERDEDKQKEKLGVVARHITRTTFRFDGAGYLPKEKWHIWTVAVADGAATPLTEGDEYDETGPRWSPDGRFIAFFSNRSPKPDLTPEAVALYLLPAAGEIVPETEWRQLPAPEGSKHSLNWSPDGRAISYVGQPGRGDWWQNDRVYLVPADGRAPAQDLTSQYDVSVSSSTMGDSGDRALSRPIWSPDGTRIYFQVSRHGSTMIYSVDRGGGDLLPVTEAGATVGSVTLDQSGQTLAGVRETLTEPGQVWIWPLASGNGCSLTELNRDWLAEIDLGEIEEVWYQGAAGNDLQGWILKPPDFDAERQYPAIVAIHGGPWLQYGYRFMHEFYFLAGQGYVICFTNPRGGQGYGEAHARAIHRTWGQADYADLMAWTDLVAERPYVDAGWLGIAGGSYGGYLTLWTIGHTDRFRVAVAQRVVSNTISFWGSSDVGLYFEDTWSGEPPWADLATYWDQSPMKYIANARTPTLFIHSELDYRCDLEQSAQAFRALRRQGIDAELVLFPEESHGLSRGGRTDRRVVRLNHMARWFDQYLRQDE